MCRNTSALRGHRYRAFGTRSLLRVLCSDIHFCTVLWRRDGSARRLAQLRLRLFAADSLRS